MRASPSVRDPRLQQILPETPVYRQALQVEVRPILQENDLLKAFFVWMRRLVADPFPLTLSLSRKGRGNPRTISSYNCQPLYAKIRPPLFNATPARLKPLWAAHFDPALCHTETLGLHTI